MAYRLITSLPPQWEDSSGNPLVGGSIESFLWNTTTPSPLYTDSAGGGSATSFTLNSLGQPQTAGGTACQLFGDSAITGGYKIVLKNAAGTAIPPTIGPVYTPTITSDISDLANTSNNALGDALIGVKRTLSGAIATTQHTYLEGVEVLYPFEFGLVGDDSDETTELTALFAAAAGKTIIFPVGKTYRSTTELVQPADTRVYMMGSVLKFVVTGAANCLLLRDRCEISGGTVELAGSAYSGHGFNGCPVLIGNYETGAGYDGCKVDVIIKSNKSNGNGVGVTGDSSDFYVNARVTENSSTLGRVVGVHWGGASAPASGTYHPHDGIIRATCLDMSYNNIEVGPIHISGAYNIVASINAGDITYGRGCYVFAGDYGAQYASAAVQRKFMRGIRVGGTVDGCLVGLAARCSNLLGTVSMWPSDIVIDGYSAHGNTTGSTCYGIDFTQSDGVTLQNSLIDGFYLGCRMEGTVNNPKIIGNTIQNIYTYAINTGTTSTPNFNDGLVENNHFIDNNVEGSAGRADILMNYCNRWMVRNNNLNSPLNTNAIRVANTSVNPRIYDNETMALVGAGPAIVVGAATDYVINPMGSNNTAATGITPYGGCPLFTLNHLGNRQFYATAAPSSGDWIVGDTWIDPTPVSGQPMGGANTVAGSPGTWTNMPNYA